MYNLNCLTESLQSKYLYHKSKYGHEPQKIILLDSKSAIVIRDAILSTNLPIKNGTLKNSFVF